MKKLDLIIIIIIIMLLLLLPIIAHAGVSASAAVHNPSISSSATSLTTNWTVAFHFNHIITGSATNSITPLWSRVTGTTTTTTCANLEILYVNSNTASYSLTAQHIAVTTGIAETAGTGHVVMQSIGTLPLSHVNYHHIAVTRSGNIWALYIDGLLDSTAIDSFSQQVGCNFNFGTAVGGIACGDTFTGEFCSWAEILGVSSVASAEQILALSKGNSPYLVGLKPVYYWAFYGYFASQMADLSGNEWNSGGTPSTVNHCSCNPPTGEGH